MESRGFAMVPSSPRRMGGGDVDWFLSDDSSEDDGCCAKFNKATHEMGPVHALGPRTHLDAGLSPSEMVSLVGSKPMSPTELAQRDAWVRCYLSSCKEHQVIPCHDAVTTLRLARPWHIVTARGFGNMPFRDLDLHPFFETLAKSDGHALRMLRALDFSLCRLGASSAVLIASLLSMSDCRIQMLDLSGQQIGSDGARALCVAVEQGRSLKVLRLKGCHVGDAGALPFQQLLDLGGDVHGLRELDLQNNLISFEAVRLLQQACEGQNIRLMLAGNRVLDEVMNAVSHGTGLVLAIIGCIFMSMAVHTKPLPNIIGVVVYSMSLILLYAASTLLHSFHALGPVVVCIFDTLDHCAIYLLISGSYCGFLLNLLPLEPRVVYILSFQWICTFLGMATSACYFGPGKVIIELTIYLGMGWSCTTVLGEMLAMLGYRGSQLLVAGGLLYTIGVPFFVKDGHTCNFPDHTLWHFFVLAGSLAHWFCIYWYCVTV